MEIYRLFNLVLVTLGLTTMLLTLASYALYKYRQLRSDARALKRPDPRSRSEASSPLLEGSFFKRYIPAFQGAPAQSASEAQPLLPRSIAAPKGLRRWLSMRLARPATASAFFLIVGGVVFVALSSQKLFDRLWNERERARVASHYEELQRLGLMKTYQYAYQPVRGLSAEAILPAQKERVASLVSDLQQVRIILINGSPTVDPWVTQWSSLLNQWRVPTESMPYAALETLSPEAVRSSAKPTLLVLPQLKAPSERLREKISQLLAQGASVLVTGMIAGDPSTHAWSEKTFGVRFAPNPTAKQSLPTIFSGEVSPGWELPPGITMTWFPVDNTEVAFPLEGTSAAFEATYRGSLSVRDDQVPTRAQYREAGAARASWLALDPPSAEASKILTDAQRFYAQEALLSSLHWTAGKPIAKPATWMGGAEGAVVLSVDSEDHFQNVEMFIRQFRQAEMPATFFLVSNLFQKFPIMASLISPQMELASHSENHEVFKDQPPQKQFDRIQASRLEIEEIAKKPVTGFRPPVEQYDEGTIDAALQNKLNYFYGDSSHLRFSPAWIASGKLLYFPRSLNDDFSIQNRRDLTSTNEMVSTLAADLDLVRRVKGAYFLGMHTQVFGESRYEGVIQGFLDTINKRKSLWKTNYGELYAWWKARSQLETRLVRNDGTLTLKLRNPSDTPIRDLAVDIDAGKGAPRIFLADTATQTEHGPSFKLDSQLGSSARILVPYLGANGKQEIKFRLD